MVGRGLGLLAAAGLDTLLAAEEMTRDGTVFIYSMGSTTPGFASEFNGHRRHRPSLRVGI